LHCLIILRKLPVDPAFATDFQSCVDISPTPFLSPPRLQHHHHPHATTFSMDATISRHSPSPPSPPSPDINITANSTLSPHHHPHLYDTFIITRAATNITPSYHHHLCLRHHATTTSMSSLPPRCRHQ
nr:hypothetical protein [Tanacetum cinerariifolium]